MEASTVVGAYLAVLCVRQQLYAVKNQLVSYLCYPENTVPVLKSVNVP